MGNVGGSQEMFSKLFGGAFKDRDEPHTAAAWKEACSDGSIFSPAADLNPCKCFSWAYDGTGTDTLVSIHNPGCVKNAEDNMICSNCQRSHRMIVMDQLGHEPGCFISERKMVQPPMWQPKRRR